jgi:putative aminopeptidase FrvX
MDREHLFHHLKALTEISAPVGRETPVQTYMEEQFRKYTADIVYDPVGNLLAHFPGKGTKTVIAAHACEIGFIIKRITEDGLLKVAPNYKTRNADTRILPFHEVTILTDTYEPIYGMFAMDTGHVIDAEARKKVPRLEDISIDIGAHSLKDVLNMGIGVGCPVTWNVKTRKMGTRAKGKSMDDRLGLTILLGLAAFLSEHPLARDIFLASTVQEEIGVQGARALASQYTFEEAYILEITPTSHAEKQLQLGKGPALVYKDGSMHYHHPLTVKCKKTAEEHNIPLQPAILERGVTDGLGFFVNSASRTVLLGCPTLYPHSPGETIDLEDLYYLGELLEWIVK